MDAESREAVFADLRARGIKAIKVIAADGSKANGEIRGIRKRVLVSSIVVTALIVGLGVFLGSRTTRHLTEDGVAGMSEFITSQMRRQVVGDAAIIERGIRDGWADVFAEEGERFLASFAVPGVPAGQRNSTPAEISAALSRTVDVQPTDGIEARQIKAMVAGMKVEARRFVSSGGSIAQYCRLLVQRQDEEIACHNRARDEIESAHKAGMDTGQLTELWEKRNAALRQMGVKLVPMPE